MGDNEIGKLFIGGVDKDTSSDDFRAFFETYGVLEDCILMKDAESELGRNRGFGFVKYQDPKCADAVLKSGQLLLNGKKLDPKHCTPRGAPRRQDDMTGGQAGGAGAGGEPDSPQKMFVGGVPQGATENSLTELFTSYGTVERVQLMTDKVTNNHKGFGFITFSSADPVQTLCKQRFVQFEGKTMECKPAESRFRPRAPVAGYGGQSSYGGGGNWQGSGDSYGYNSSGGGGWGGNQQQQQQMGAYGGQSGYGGAQSTYGGGYASTQNGSGGYGTGYGSQSGGYGGQSGGYSGQSGGYGAQNAGGYNQYSQQQQQQSSSNYSAAGSNQGYGGGYGGGYSSTTSTPSDQYGSSGGYNASGSIGGDMSGGSYSSSDTSSYTQNSQTSAGGGSSGKDTYGSGGPTSANYGQRMGNSVQQFHPYRR